MKVKLKLKIENNEFENEFIIANLSNLNGLLGMNFLQTNRIQLAFGWKLMKHTNGKLKINKGNQSICTRIKLCETVKIPANSEMFVDTFIEGECDSGVGIAK